MIFLCGAGSREGRRIVENILCVRDMGNKYVEVWGKLGGEERYVEDCNFIDPK